jgi:hypothetical protein
MQCALERGWGVISYGYYSPSVSPTRWLS